MTPEEFNQRMTQLHGLVSGDFAADVMAAPVAGILMAIKKRITEQGLNTQGTQIGDYSTKPIYVTRKEFAKPGAFTAQGKLQKAGQPSTTIFGARQFNKRFSNQTLRGIGGKDFTKTKGQQTMYLPQGYKELRDIQGLRTDFVNSWYRGDLIRDYAMAKQAQSFVIGFKTASSMEKRINMERKFNCEIYYPMQTEIDNYFKAVTFTVDRLTRGVLETGEYIKPTISADTLIPGGLF